MKINYILVILLFFFFVLGTFYASNDLKNENVQEVFNLADLKANCQIKEIKQTTDRFDIDVYYPESLYRDLNLVIEEKMNYHVENFLALIDELTLLEGRKFKLQITFSSNEYKDYISYVFEVFEDYCGAHPGTTIWTISYDTKENKIVDIKYLSNKNKDILNILSKESFEILKMDEVIKEAQVEEMVLDGTKPKEKNFSDFAFTEEGFKIFFERYSIAPYALGDFVVIIPYDKLNI